MELRYTNGKKTEVLNIKRVVVLRLFYNNMIINRNLKIKKKTWKEY